MKYLIFIFLVLQLNSTAFGSGENNPPAGDTLRSHELDLGIEFGTTRLYRGIKSSSNPYLRPSVMYTSPGGFYAGLASYISLDSGHVDETDLSAGYELVHRKRTTLSLEFIHYFFRNNQLANAEVKNEVEFFWRQDFGTVLTSKLYFDLDFGNGTIDKSVTFDLSHEFIVEEAFNEDASLSIIPSFSVTAGSLNLVRKVKKDIVNAGFGVTNYDLSLALEYYIGRFILSPELVYDFPVSKKIPLLQKTKKSDPVSYFTASVIFVID